MSRTTIAGSHGRRSSEYQECPLLRDLSARRPSEEAAMNGKAIVVQNQTAEQIEVVADLNALMRMVGYVEAELERLAPDCAVVASTLRSSIINAIISRKARLQVCGGTAAD